MDLMLDITTHQGYMVRFWQLVSENSDTRSPMQTALNSLEAELRAFHGLRRYSTYKSFSTVKSRRYRRGVSASFKIVKL